MAQRLTSLPFENGTTMERKGDKFYSPFFIIDLYFFLLNSSQFAAIV